MANGFRTGNTCYSTVDEAADAYFASAQPFLFESNAHVMLITYEKVAGKWSWGVLDTGTMTKSYNTLQNPLFPSCDPAQGLQDGISMGWMVGTVLIAVAAIASMKRGAR